MSGIPLHKKYGVNPSVFDCFYCGEAAGLILPGSRTKKFKEAGLADADGQMHHSIGVLDMEPCQKCKEHMAQGVILISVKDGDQDPKNPYRTGGWVVVKDAAMEKIVQPKKLADQIRTARFAFVPDEAWDMIGLPRGEMEGVPSE